MTSEIIAAVLPTHQDLCEQVKQVRSSYMDGEIVVGLESPVDPDGDRMVSWVSITGEWTGHLQVLTTPKSARDLAACMFQMEADDLSQEEIADAFGEIANMVGGGVKGMVGVHTALSLPQVVLDAKALVSPDAHQRTVVNAVWKGEPIEFSLWERGPKEGIKR